MAQYRRRNSIKSPYQQKHGDDPYRSQAGDLYRKLLDRYKQHRPTGGSPRHGGGSKYRSNVVRYHSGSGYKSKAKEDTRSQVIVRREPSPRMEFPEYRPQPDVEVLLKELEKRFDEKLLERVLEIMEKEFDRTHAETIGRHDLSENTSDDNLQERLEPLGRQEGKASGQSEPGKDHTIEAIPQIDAVQSPPESSLRVEDDDDTETENTDVEDTAPPSKSGPLEIISENPPPAHTSESTVAPEQTPEPEATMLEDRLLIADIEALYDELEADQLEPEEEPLEYTY